MRSLPFPATTFLRRPKFLLHLTNCLSESGEVTLDDCPDPLQQDSKVFMGDAVAQPGDLPPGYTRILVLGGSRKVTYRFADDFKATDHRILHQAASAECLLGHSLRVDFDVLEVEARVAGHKMRTSWARIRSLSRGLIAAYSTRSTLLP